MTRENFFTLRRKSEELRKLAMQGIGFTEEQIEPKRSYASAHTEDSQMNQVVGSPKDAQCKYFCPKFNAKDMEDRC